MENTATLVGLPLPAQTPAPAQEQGQDKVQAKESAENESILGDLSFAQVIATALAGATSFALADRIGVAGSLIGAAIGTVVTVVGSQIFKQIINKSADKLESFVRQDGAEREEELFLSKANRLQRKWQVAVCLIACAICSVFIYAAIVNFATNGKGIGTSSEAAYTTVEEGNRTGESPALAPAPVEMSIPADGERIEASSQEPAQSAPAATPGTPAATSGTPAATPGTPTATPSTTFSGTDASSSSSATPDTSSEAPAAEEAPAQSEAAMEEPVETAPSEIAPADEATDAAAASDPVSVQPEV